MPLCYYERRNTTRASARVKINLRTYDSNKLWPSLKRFTRIHPIIQRDSSACGPSCLAMLLEFHGLDVDLAKLRLAAQTSPSGTDMRTLRDLARDSGLDARGARMTFGALSRLAQPTIVHYDNSHFIVVENIDTLGVHVVDPAFGRATLIPSDFGAKWQGVTLLINGPQSANLESPVGRRVEVPKPEWLVKRGRFVPKQVRQYYVNAFRGLGKSTLIVLLCALMLQGLGLVFPFLTGRIIDSASGLSNGGLLAPFVGGLVAATLAQILVIAARDLLITRSKVIWEERFFSFLFTRVVRFPIRTLDQYRREDIVARFQTNTTIRQLFSSGFIQGGFDGLLIFVYIGIIAFYSWIASIVCLAVAILLAITSRSFAAKLKNGSDRSYKANVRASGSILETILAAETVKLLGIEHERMLHWSERFRHALTIDSLNEGTGRRVSAVSLAVTGLGQALIYAIIGKDVLAGKITLGDFAAVSAIYMMVTSRVQFVASLWIQVSTVSVALSKVNDLLIELPESPVDGTIGLRVVEGLTEEPLAPQTPRSSKRVATPGAHFFKGPLEIEELSFRYRTNGPDVLSKVNLRIEPGETVSFVGRNGSGKSTLIKILSLLYHDYSGTIKWSGHDVRTLSLSRSRQRIGSIPQTVHIFEGTVRQNLLLVAPQATTVELDESLKLSGLLSDLGDVNTVLALPLLPGGANLSGGQRLKLAFARLFLTAPDLVLLDEATSALDATSENSIFTNLRAFFPKCTIISAAHRLATVIDSDKICVFSQGIIVEQGTHHQLVATGGPYSELLVAYSGERQP